MADNHREKEPVGEKETQTGVRPSILRFSSCANFISSDLKLRVFNDQSPDAKFASLTAEVTGTSMRVPWPGERALKLKVVCIT
jgi:hypothetical protein